MKRTNRKKGIAVMLTAILAISVTLSPVARVNATSIDEIKEQQEETRSKKKEAEAALADLNQKKTDILEVIQELDNQISAYENQIKELTKQRNNLQAEISITQLKIYEANVAENKQYEDMKLRIQYAYENGEVEYLDALMATNDFTEIVNQSEYVEQISVFDKSQLDDLIEIRESIAEYEVTLQDALVEVEEIKAEAEDEKEALEVMEEGKKAKLAEYQTAINDTEGEISRLEQEEKKQDAQIAELERQAEERRKQAAAAAAAAASSSGSSSTPAPSYSGGPFKWPMPASGRITSGFGGRNAPTAGASSYHKGIDIGCPSGSTVVAAASGTVIYTGYMSSAGNAVIIDHGGGLTTLYYHLSGFAVSPGTNVSAGQTIAYSGNTGVSTGPHLHFSVRVNGTYVNPMNYF